MHILDWYTAVLKKYATFKGRAPRREYWWFTLADFIITLAIALISIQILKTSALSNLYWIALLIPRFAVTTRRFHDIGKSGWWVFFLTLAPVVLLFFSNTMILSGAPAFGRLLLFAIFIPSIIMLVFCCTKSQPGSNQYGPNPNNPPDNKHTIEVKF